MKKILSGLFGGATSHSTSSGALTSQHISQAAQQAVTSFGQAYQSHQMHISAHAQAFTGLHSVLQGMPNVNRDEEIAKNLPDNVIEKEYIKRFSPLMKALKENE